MDVFGGLRDPKRLVRGRLSQLIADERRRAQLHLRLLRLVEPDASPDRLAHLIVDRWAAVAAVEGGLTGAAGLVGIPFNALLFTYCQLAVTVSIAEAYGVELEGAAGEDTVLSVIGRVHGLEEVVRASPRVLGAVVRSLALRGGLPLLGRAVPFVAAPIGARLNRRDLARTGQEALRRFGRVLLVAPLVADQPR